MYPNFNTSIILVNILYSIQNVLNNSVYKIYSNLNCACSLQIRLSIPNMAKLCNKCLKENHGLSLDNQQPASPGCQHIDWKASLTKALFHKGWCYVRWHLQGIICECTLQRKICCRILVLPPKILLFNCGNCNWQPWNKSSKSCNFLCDITKKCVALLTCFIICKMMRNMVIE